MLIDRMGVRVGGVSQAVVDLPHTRAAEFFGWHAGQLQHFCKSNATPAQVILKTTLETKHLHKVGRLELGQCWRPRCWSLRSHHFLGLRSPPPITLTPHHSPKTLRPIFSPASQRHSSAFTRLTCAARRPATHALQSHRSPSFHALGIDPAPNEGLRLKSIPQLRPPWRRRWMKAVSDSSSST
jgi:hypothetical protein